MIALQIALTAFIFLILTVLIARACAEEIIVSNKQHIVGCVVILEIFVLVTALIWGIWVV